MITKIIEATSGFNWGKFLLSRMDTEWERLATVDGMPVPRVLLGSLGWSRDHLWVLDLATGEGALFRPGGLAAADLNKHRIWVCPLFEPFLGWLYGQDLGDLQALPDLVELPGVRPSMAGYRRSGTPRSPEAQRAYEDGVRDEATLKEEFGGIGR